MNRMLRSSEDEIILSLARFDLRPVKERIVSTLATSELDWAYIFTESRSHGVAPLIYYNLKALGLISKIPRKISETFKKDYYRTSALNLLLGKSLEEILVKMAEKAVPVIPLKGCFFMSALYPLIALRPMIDLDLLVKEEDFSRASGVLKEIGYKEVFDPQRPRSAREYYAMAFENREKAVVELHKAMYQRFSDSLDLEGLWSRAKRTRLMGREVWVMSTEDVVLFLCLHLAQHDFRIRLISLVDLSEIITRKRNHIRWDFLAALAESQGVMMPVYLALLLLKEWFDRKIPARILHKLRPSAIRQVYLQKIFDPGSLKFLRLDLPQRLTQVLLLPALMDRPAHSLRFMVSYLGLRIRDLLTGEKAP